MPDPSLPLDLHLDAAHPELLNGLDAWLQLGLLSDAQVRRLARDRLTCPRPEPVITPAERRDFSASDFADEPPVPAPPSQPARPVAARAPQTAPPPAAIAKLTHWWQAFQAELSVRWLLFLGVFLVVASSSVLAASQWSRFSPLGQYAVLWGYTLAFGAAGLAARRSQHLRLTGQSLQLVALLLIPINTWAIDGLGLWAQVGNWPAIALATLSLGALAWSQRQSWPRLAIATLWATSLLHWGWAIASWPTLAVQLGAIASVAVSQWQVTRRGRAALSTLGWPGYAIAVLLSRALVAANLPAESLSLAIALLGWLVAVPRPQLALPASLRRLLLAVGSLLLALGWAVTVSEPQPWQTVGISLLAIALCLQRLRLGWHWWDLLVLFPLGGQCCLQIARLLPDPWWQQAATSLETWTGYDRAATALGLSLSFAYSATFIAAMTELYRRQQTQLAYFGEWLAIALGGWLWAWSLWDATLVLLSGSLETLLLLAVTVRRPRRLTVYLTHGSLVLTLGAALARAQPEAELATWALALLGLALLHWLLVLVLGERSLPRRGQALRCSSWLFGCAGAASSYLLWTPSASAMFATGTANPLLLSWLSIPAALSLLAARYQRSVNATLATAALVVGPILVLGNADTRLVGLGVATGLMAVNVCWLRQFSATLLHLGFALAWLAAFGWAHWQRDGWTLAATLTVVVLLALPVGLTRLTAQLASLYRQAAVLWAEVLSVVLGLAIAGQISASYQHDWPATWVPPVAALVLAVAWLSCGRGLPQRGVAIASSLALELAVAGAIVLAGGTRLHLAAANIGVALAWLLLADGLLGRRWARWRSPHWAGLPLALAAFGFALRWGEFEAYTGLLTLGAALVALGSSRRRPDWRSLSYLGLAGLTVGWYELVYYPLSQAAGGNRADGLTILAGVALAIALVYRLLTVLWQRRGAVALFNLRPVELRLTADLHWAIAALLLVGALVWRGPEPLQLAAASVAAWAVLALYACGQGRAAKPAAEIWVYLGLASFAGSLAYARFAWELTGLDPWWLLLVGAIALVCELSPWERWGWPARPWQRAAVALPALALLAAQLEPPTPTLDLLGLAAVYGAIASSRRQWRWTYASVALLAWALERWLLAQAWLEPASVWGFLLGLALLYVAQVEPPQRRVRHAWRLAGCSVLGVTSLLFYSETGLLPLGLGALAIALGLGLQVRAYLFAGTATFVLAAAYQLVVLSLRYALLKWILGLIAGLLLIAIAANFERSREQVNSAWQNWLGQLRNWA